MVVQILLIVVGIIVGLIVIMLLAAALRPADFQITRSQSMTAAPGAVFALVNDFHKWELWSPWAKLDPQMKETFEGPATGPGAIHTWNGNNKVGEGRATITEARPDQSIRLTLQFIRPFKATNDVEFTFQPAGNQTNVTWTMTGKHNFMGKVFSMIMNMDKLVGTDFEKGLSAMKAAVEA